MNSPSTTTAKPTFRHTILAFLKKLDRALPAPSSQPQAMQGPGLKLFLHGVVVTVPTGTLRKQANKQS